MITLLAFFLYLLVPRKERRVLSSLSCRFLFSCLLYVRVCTSSMPIFELDWY